LANGKRYIGDKVDKSCPVYDTTLCCLCLEVYYKFLPTYVQIGEDNENDPTWDDNDIKIRITGAL